MRPVAALGLALAVAAGCAGSAGTDDSKGLFDSIPGDTPIVVTNNVGPVRAELRIRPATPRLGDVVFLELKVSGPDAVDVEMPEFGEALGRFSIVDFDFRDSRDSDDGDSLVREQLYQLQAAASGKVRLPQLRIEITDRRPDAESGGEPQELLTDEVLLDVAPIEIADGDTELRANLGTIEIKPLRPWHSWWFWIVLIAAIVLAAALFSLRWLRHARVVARQTAYELALERLSLMRGAGLPEADELDAWYVELSSIIRHYLEGRFSVRAPELTTEEFLREAGRSQELSAAHRTTLAEFLAGCDRVKFAGHKPPTSEQQEALGAALRFVEDTRPMELAA